MYKKHLEDLQRKFKNNKQLQTMLGALQNNKKKKTEQNAQFLFCTSNEREICGVVRRLLLGSDEDEFDLNP
jgi:hypothetical protein